ncbi:MAG: D-glycerate dehydrogenase [Caulobacteraceae bacterium]
MKPRVLTTRRLPEAVERRLADTYDVTLARTDEGLSAADMAAAMRDFDALCPTILDRIGADALATPGRRVRMLANYGVGFEHIDVKACEAAGVMVSNTPDVLTEATAEIAILLMLTLARRGGEGERQLRAGEWQGWRPTHMMGSDLRGKRLGLIGFGRIGQVTARMARAGWGMAISYHARRRATPEVEASFSARYCDTVEALLAEADVVSLHAAGGPDSRHLINAERLALMKPSAMLINTARGPVVDEAALVRALTAGQIAGAGLDVYEREPAVHPGLLGLENVVLFPHLGSATVETRVAMGMRMLDNLDRFFAGLPLLDRVA